MHRPTISLCLIAKNEAKNINRLLDSVEGCFDAIHLTDTGSTDETVELALKRGINVHHFSWIHDFSAARNYSFSFAETDYVMWMDLDDVLSDREAFIKWRDHAMVGAEYWLATYNYAFTPEGKVACSFSRERVIKNHSGFKWRYFIHEGIMPPERKIIPNFVNSWAINHMRSIDDINQDRNRNLNIFELRKDELDSRLKFYYGKELFEAGRTKEAIPQLMKTVGLPDLEQHDRILGIQYLCLCLIKEAPIVDGKITDEGIKYLSTAKEYSYQGLMLFPHRAEFYCFVGDACLKMGQLAEAIPSFEAAKRCFNQSVLPNGVASPIFSYQDSYTTYPRVQLARIFAQMQDPDRAQKEINECVELFPDHLEAKVLKAEIEKFRTHIEVPKNSLKTGDIAFTCHPMDLYEWDYDVYLNKGIGGSETALVEVAHHIKQLTGRRVLVFNTRKEKKICEGVEYLPLTKMKEYFSEYEPALHIAWRHNLKATEAKTLVWCHDLITPHSHVIENYEKIMCLSEFHKNYLHSMGKVPLEKIILTRNGLNPKRFEHLITTAKKYGKIVYSSSSDRGLDKAIHVMDHVHRENKDACLYIYYGFDNMLKFGMKAEVDYYMGLIESRKDYVKLVGNVTQERLAQEFAEAMVWLYPTHFLETYCITALEALACQVYPVTRRIGGLQDTIPANASPEMYSMLNHGADTEVEREAYAQEVLKAISENRWKNVKLDIDTVSWKKVAADWVRDHLSGECI